MGCGELHSEEKFLNTDHNRAYLAGMASADQHLMMVKLATVLILDSHNHTCMSYKSQTILSKIQPLLRYTLVVSQLCLPLAVPLGAVSVQRSDTCMYMPVHSHPLLHSNTDLHQTTFVTLSV